MPTPKTIYIPDESALTYARLSSPVLLELSDAQIVEIALRALADHAILWSEDIRGWLDSTSDSRKAVAHGGKRVGAGRKKQNIV